PPLSRAADYAWDRQQLDAVEVFTALSGIPASVWRPSTDERAVIVAAAVPMRWHGDTRAALVYERPSEALLVLANRAVAKLIAASLLAVLVAGLVLFGFAGVLSLRIRRLHHATERVLKPDGRLDPKLPHLNATDEIGDLARSFAKLLGEIGDYNDYLKTLASKLSHELNTPLAIVRSSLDNMDHEALPPAARVYAARARDGADRLWGILRTMSEASRMERAIDAAEGEDFDLTEVVRGYAESYRQLAGNRTVHVLLPEQAVAFYGAPELIAQALDKLFDNARGFTPEDGWIRIQLSAETDGALIAVANSGPPLPQKMHERLFDSMVSLRDTGNLRATGVVPHLGLGLYIVRLIAAAHQGSASAENLPGDNGVEFQLKLRGMQRPKP
ncbi:MAG: histidine kinase, partial [Lysobacterales bacterium CG_4_9_14_3_um_filter_62_6]